MQPLCLLNVRELAPTLRGARHLLPLLPALPSAVVSFTHRPCCNSTLHNLSLKIRVLSGVQNPASYLLYIMKKHKPGVAEPKVGITPTGMFVPSWALTPLSTDSAYQEAAWFKIWRHLKSLSCSTRSKQLTLKWKCDTGNPSASSGQGGRH